MEDVKKETNEGEINHAICQIVKKEAELVDTFRQIMEVSERALKTTRTMIDFVEQKGLLQEFEAYAAERLKEAPQ